MTRWLAALPDVRAFARIDGWICNSRGAVLPICRPVRIPGARHPDLRGIPAMTYRIGTVVALTMLAAASGVVAIQAQEQPASSSTAIQDAKPSGGVAQGIKVHGHWTIEVRNPDGSVASRTEFENALAPDAGFGGGAALLAMLLGSERSPGKWSVLAHGTSIFDGPCVPAVTPPNGVACGISQPDLRVNVPRTGSLPNRSTGVLELSGSFTVQNPAAVIGRVETRMFACDSAFAPSTCPEAHIMPFTSHTLTTPIPAAREQIVQIKVVISFS
jgi:hypothetical protein